MNPVTELLLEEIGHKIDRLLNGSIDSPGDEGAIFRLLATGQNLSADTLAELKIEDDHATIKVDGQFIVVENQAFIGIATAGEIRTVKLVTVQTRLFQKVGFVS